MALKGSLQDLEKQSFTECTSEPNIAARRVKVCESVLPNGAATETTLLAVLNAVDQLEGFTDGIEALLTTIRDNADQLEGYLDGVEGSLASIDAGVPATLGETTKANSMPVVLASDQVIPVTTTSNLAATYSASITGLNVAANPTDIFTIVGSNTKTIKIISITFSATKTNSSIVDVILLKRSTDNTGGTFTTPTKVPHNSTDPASTATIRAYTANPTLGTLAGNLRSDKILIPSGTSSSSPITNAIESVSTVAKPITLIGESEAISLNLNGVSVNGSSINISVIWIEE
jgi:hypothetical protein